VTGIRARERRSSAHRSSGGRGQTKRWRSGERPPAQMERIVTGADLLLLAVLGAMLFRLARPLRDRLEAWYAHNVLPNSTRGRIIDLQRRKGGVFSAEDRDGD